jgi:Ca2+-binding RTX toxin-like protein
VHGSTPLDLFGHRFWIRQGKPDDHRWDQYDKSGKESGSLMSRRADRPRANYLKRLLVQNRGAWLHGLRARRLGGLGLSGGARMFRSWAVATLLVVVALQPEAAWGTDAGNAGPTCFGMPATIVGTDGDDLLVGTDGPDVIVGLAGTDRIEPGAGDDRVCAGPGGIRSENQYSPETILSTNEGVNMDSPDIADNTGDDLLDGGPGFDYIEGGPGSDRLFGGQGNDTMFASDIMDSQSDNEGRDFMSGSGGGDLLLEAAGSLLAYGGPGDDLMHFAAGNAVFFGGRGSDRVEGAFSPAQSEPFAVYLGRGNDDAIIEALGAGPAARGVARGGPGDDELKVGGNRVLVDLHGDDGNDRLTVVRLSPSHRRVRFFGNAGADVLTGSNGPDLLRGGSGPDTLRGARGADKLQGNRGDDILRGGSGADTLRGNRGNDVLRGQTGRDVNYGDRGSDLCRSPATGPRAHSCER